MNKRPRPSIPSASLGALLALGAALGAAQAPPLRPDTSAQNAPLDSEPEMNERLYESVRLGLEFLAAQQNADGSFGPDTRFSKNVGITGLCALAFMSDGHLPGRGRYGPNVEKALDFVLSQCTETGLIVGGESHGPMYGHGFATLFLGEIYGMGGVEDDARLRESLVKAVRLIVQCQNPEGGWRYNPLPEDADVSVTICQIMALRSARNAGIKVPKETIDRAVEYVRLCQNPDGGFRYMSVPGASAWPRSAAGLASLNYAGIYEDEALEKGLTYLHENAPPGGTRQQAHYFYGIYYTAQAMYLAGGDHWRRWWPKARDEIISRQDRGSGSWNDPHAGGPYATAMALIVLQMPKRYLPIFQK
ncbi:MAG: terpene cyclase/mutase family protein [Phycisphaerales bacterium]|nr:terpene cyclase/mutase family protein [Phycisphaerales bacterium]